MKPNSQRQLGFTLIEMIVSLGLFSIVVTVAVGALLVLINTNQQLQAEQSVMTNLSFAIDSMSREIRTGTNYFCDSRVNANAGANGERIFLDNHVLDADPTQDCPRGNNLGRNYQGISFIEGGESVTKAPDTRIVYYYDNNPSSPNQGKIMRRVSGQSAQSIVSSGIYIKNAEFFVTGSHPVTGNGGGALEDNNQALVTIYIEAAEKLNATKTYKIQTTITQRTLDI